MLSIGHHILDMIAVAVLLRYLPWDENPSLECRCDRKMDSAWFSFLSMDVWSFLNFWIYGKLLAKR
jgi:hypothetical protein